MASNENYQNEPNKQTEKQCFSNCGIFYGIYGTPCDEARKNLPATQRYLRNVVDLAVVAQLVGFLLSECDPGFCIEAAQSLPAPGRRSDVVKAQQIAVISGVAFDQPAVRWPTCHIWRFTSLNRTSLNRTGLNQKCLRPVQSPCTRRAYSA